MIMLKRAVVIITYLVLCSCTVTLSDTVELLHLIRNKPFSSIWNVPSHRCEQKYGIKLNTSFFDIDTNLDDDFMGDQIALFYRDRLGLYPYIDGDGTFVNGGLPQLGDIRSHLIQTQQDVDYYIPADNFTGLAVIDWEEWRPIFERNNYNNNQRKYIKVSEEVIKRQHPDWSSDKIRHAANVEFSNAARSFMQTTLMYARMLRPSGVWGYYGFPRCYNHKLGESSCTNDTRQMNDELWWLFNSSSVLVPSIYLDKKFGNHRDRHVYVRGQLFETRRVHRLYNNKAVPILPYTEFVYRDSGEFYDIEDLRNSIEQSSFAGLNGVVMWGSSNMIQDRADCVRVRDYVQTTLGPFVKNLTDFMSNCSGSLCNSHGRCVAKTWFKSGEPMTGDESNWLYIIKDLFIYIIKLLNVEEKYSEFNCECEDGWNGPFCHLPV